MKWMEQARILINLLINFPKDENLIMVIRHSEREPLNSLKKNSDLQLTSDGLTASRLFGKELPLDRKIRIFHSNRDRCRDTAQGILKGFIECGGRGIMGGDFEPLYTFRFKNGFFKSHMKNNTLVEITNKWIAGIYSPDDIEPLQECSKKAAKKIWLKNGEISPGDIDIHVTHESLLMFLRTGWFGLDPNKKWPNFLGGYAFSLRQDYIYLLDYDEFMELPYPYWRNQIRL